MHTKASRRQNQICDTGGIAQISFSLDDQSVYTLLEDGSFVITPSHPEWCKYCQDMDTAEGWIKDDNGGHLLWVPGQFCDMVRDAMTLRARPGKTTERVPVIDHEAVLGIQRERWAELFEAFAESDP